MRVVVADDHTLIRLGVRALLQGTEMDVVAEVANGDGAVAQAVKLGADLVLMDLEMPGMSGLAATRVLKAEHPRIKVVIFTVSERERDFFAALKAGADGYLLKAIGRDELLTALRQAAAGQSPIAPAMAGLLMREIRDPGGDVAPLQPPSRLSPREAEVLSLVSRGLTYREIASRLVLSENTVRNHVRQILHKLDLRSRTEAVRYAVEQGMFSG